MRRFSVRHLLWLVVPIALIVLTGMGQGGPSLTERVETLEAELSALETAVDAIEEGFISELQDLTQRQDAQQVEIDELKAASLRVFDSTGTEIGLLVDWPQGGESISVYLENIGAYSELSTRTGLLQDEDFSEVSFAGAGCTGQPYLVAGGNGAASRLFSPIIEGTERYFVGSNELAENVPVESFASFGRIGNATCGGPTGTGLRTVLAEEISLEAIGLSFPLPLPIYIAPEAP